MKRFSYEIRIQILSAVSLSVIFLMPSILIMSCAQDEKNSGKAKKSSTQMASIEEDDSTNTDSEDGLNLAVIDNTTAKVGSYSYSVIPWLGNATYGYAKLGVVKVNNPIYRSYTYKMKIPGKMIQPAVFVSPVSYSGADPVMIQITQVKESFNEQSFSEISFRVVELPEAPKYDNGAHISESFYFLIISDNSGGLYTVKDSNTDPNSSCTLNVQIKNEYFPSVYTFTSTGWLSPASSSPPWTYQSFGSPYWSDATIDAKFDSNLANTALLTGTRPVDENFFLTSSNSAYPVNSFPYLVRVKFSTVSGSTKVQKFAERYRSAVTGGAQLLLARYSGSSCDSFTKDDITIKNIENTVSTGWTTISTDAASISYFISSVVGLEEADPMVLRYYNASNNLQLMIQEPGRNSHAPEKVSSLFFSGRGLIESREEDLKIENYIMSEWKPTNESQKYYLYGVNSVDCFRTSSANTLGYYTPDGGMLKTCVGNESSTLTYFRFIPSGAGYKIGVTTPVLAERFLKVDLSLDSNKDNGDIFSFSIIDNKAITNKPIPNIIRIKDTKTGKFLGFRYTAGTLPRAVFSISPLYLQIAP